MTDARLPDGTVLRFPDDTPDEVIDRAVQQHLSGAEPAPAEGGLLHRLGVGARDALVGVASVPGMAYDLAGAGINAVTGGIEALGGPSIPRVRRASENLESVADAAGLPHAQGAGEQRVSAIARGVAGVAPTLAVGGALQGIQGAVNAAPSLARGLAAALAGNPVSQLVGGATGGLSGELAAEAGAGPWGQLGASVLGGFGGAAATQAAGAAGRTAGALLQPLTEGGRQRIVGDILLRSANDPENLSARIAAGTADTEARLPASPVTTAQAARDPGLMILESGARSQAAPTNGNGVSPAIALRNVDAARNNARTAALGDMGDGASPSTRGAAVRGALGEANEAMTARVDQAFDRARATNVGRYPMDAVLEDARAALRSFDPANGGGGVPGELQGVMDDIARLGPLSLDQSQNLRARLGDIAGRAAAAGDRRLASAAGSISATLERAVDDPQWMRAVDLRRQQGQAVGRDATGSSATGAILARDQFGMPTLADTGVANRALQSPDTARQTMEALFKALEDGRAARLPTEQLEALRQRLDDLRGALRGQFVDNLLRASSTGSDLVDAAGQMTRALSPAQFRRAWEANLPIAREIFEPSQLRQLHRIASDFAEEAAASRTASTGGSATAQNLAVGNLISRATGGLVQSASTMGQTIGGLGRVLPWLYQVPEAATRDLLTRAITDPAVAQQALAATGARAAGRAAADRAAGLAGQGPWDRLVQSALQGAGRAGIRAGAAEAAPAGLLGNSESERRRRGLLH